MQAQTARRLLAGALRTLTCRRTRAAWPGESTKRSQCRGFDNDFIIQVAVAATGHARHANLALSALQGFQLTHAPFRRAAVGDMVSQAALRPDSSCRSPLALRRDGGSRAGTPFPAEEDGMEGSALDVARLQGLLSDADAPASDCNRALLLSCPHPAPDVGT